MLLYEPLARGEWFMKKKMKVLLSLFCILFTGILVMINFVLTDNSNSTFVQINSSLTQESNLEDVSNLEGVSNIVDEKLLDDDSLEVEVKQENTEESKATTDDEVVVEEESVKEESNKVYDGMTLEELASKLNRSLKNELSDKGYLYASYTLEKGVDPYLAVAISLEETGCNANCSSLMKTCNNVGGMKGNGCGAYGYFDTIDDGIKAFIDNIYKNYVAYGLTTADTMHHKYAENPLWATNVNKYIERIKNT